MGSLVVQTVKNTPAMQETQVQTVKNTPAMQETQVQSLGEEDPLERKWLQYSCLENPMDRGAWWAIVHGFAKSLDPTERLSLTLISFNTQNNHTRCILFCLLYKKT